MGGKKPRKSSGGPSGRTPLFLSATLTAWVMFAGSALGAGFTVDSLGDSGDSNPGNAVCAGGGSCTLRAAIEEANALAGPDSIDFSVTGVIDAGSELAISTQMTITGPGPDDLTVRRPASAAGDYRIFLAQNNSGQVFGATIAGMEIAGGASQLGGAGVAVGGPTQLVLRDVTVRDNAVRGFLAQGGGILVGSVGSVYLVDSTVRDNIAAGLQADGLQNGGSGMGGGIYASGTLIARGSTISGNSTTAANGKSPGGHGGNSTGGGIWTVKEANLESTTISGNSATSPGSAGEGGFPGVATGGGIHAQSGRTDLNGVTLAGNNSTSGGNLYAGTGAAEVYLQSSIVANGGGLSNCAISPGAAAINSQGHNLGTDASCNLTAGTDIGGDPSLGPLQLNGGSTETHAIQRSSPAVDAGFRSAGLQSLLGITLTSDFTDQRGEPRPFDFADEPNASGGDGTDIGAFEVQADEGTFACSDGIDNDGDLLIDFPDDPGCGTTTDDDETDASLEVFCKGQLATIIGTPAKNTLNGTPGDDVIASGAGSDKVRAGAGDDVVCGGSASDKLIGGDGKDDLAGQGGNDDLRGGPSRDSLNGGPGKDSCDAGGQAGDRTRDCER